MATFNVSNTNDSGLGSLRQAIEDANAATGLDTIKFDNNLSGQKIILTSGELKITDDLSIKGLGSDLLTVSGNNASRVLRIDDGDFSNEIDVTLDGLTITEGTTTDNGGGILNTENLTILNSKISDNSGGGISNTDGYLTVANSTISDNTGVGIDSIGFLEVTESTISGNTNFGISFGFGNFQLTDSTISNNTGGGINASRADIEITNSTISGNTTFGDGGGISTFLVRGQISNSTIAYNTADSDGDGFGNGGGVAIVAGLGIVLNNNIIAANFDNSPADGKHHPDLSGIGFSSNGYNLIGDITGLTFPNLFIPPGDIFGTSDNPLDPLLGPLQDNGGSTQTHALLASSPAIDAGDPDFESPPKFDQRGRGFPRVLDGDGDGTATVDIGAFEIGNDLMGIRVEAEDYTDYYDTTPGNIGGAYRNDDLAPEATNDVGDGFNVGWIAEGEWLTCIFGGGLYQPLTRVVSEVDGSHRLDISLDRQTTSLSFTGTGDWQSWEDDSSRGLNLSAGSHELHLDMGSCATFNLIKAH